MSEKPTIEEHAKNMEDAWRSAEEQNIIFSRKIDALKGAVRSALQQCNDKDEVIERLRGLLNSCHKALESIADDRGMDDVAHILWSWAGGMTVDDVGYVIDSGQADGGNDRR